jgi:hypothetical protein
MIYAMATDGTLLVMLNEKDVSTMRQGNTTFVDERSLKGASFTRIVLSLHKTDQSALEMLKSVNPTAKKALEKGMVPEPEPNIGETRCIKCRGVMAIETLFEGKCICCWAAQAKQIEAQSN